MLLIILGLAPLCYALQFVDCGQFRPFGAGWLHFDVLRQIQPADLVLVVDLRVEELAYVAVLALGVNSRLQKLTAIRLHIFVILKRVFHNLLNVAPLREPLLILVRGFRPAKLERMLINALGTA